MNALQIPSRSDTPPGRPALVDADWWPCAACHVQYAETPDGYTWDGDPVCGPCSRKYARCAACDRTLLAPCDVVPSGGDALCPTCAAEESDTVSLPPSAVASTTPQSVGGGEESYSIGSSYIDPTILEVAHA